MPRYRTAFLIALAAILLLASPALARDFRAALAKTDAAEHTASINRNLAQFGHWTLVRMGVARSGEAPPAADARPLALADFAGSWSRHGIGVTFLPNGQGYAQFRTYRWCDDVQPGEACDDPNGGPITAMGHAVLTITRTADRTAYGTISESNGEHIMPNGPFTLTEYQHGIGTLRTGDRPVGWAPSDGPGEIVICGPRSESMPDWVRAQHPCGA